MSFACNSERIKQESYDNATTEIKRFNIVENDMHSVVLKTQLQIA
jgi:hypothetical protein